MVSLNISQGNSATAVRQGQNRTTRDMFSGHKKSVGLGNASQKAQKDMRRAGQQACKGQQAYP